MSIILNTHFVNVVYKKKTFQDVSYNLITYMYTCTVEYIKMITYIIYDSMLCGHNFHINNK